MTAVDWKEMYPDGFMFALTNEERKYLALDPIAQDAQTITYIRKEGNLNTRVTVFFEGNLIVKVINESLAGMNGTFWMHQYEEYDTRLQTEGRELLLPLTARGKAKKLTASNINAVTPFGCRLYIQIRNTRLCMFTEMYLTNPRSNKRFPLGEWEAIKAIRSEEDFRAFLARYIATCRNDYFDKLQAFRDAEKVTVQYRPGDIFRIDYDRTRYGYGIITGEMKRLKMMAELSGNHSFNHLMTVPLMVRLYRIITEDPGLTPDELARYPLGPGIICSDNDIIWGTHPVIGHKVLTPDALYFKLNCTLQPRYTGRFTLEGCSMIIEWGFASVTLTYDQISAALKKQLDRFSLRAGAVSTGIAPWFLSADGTTKYTDERCDLLTPQNSDLRAEVFACLGLDADATFDQFAEKFGGLTLQEIVSRMQ